MNCKKCQDLGFIEHHHGLLIEFCDCEIGKQVLAKRRAIYGIPEDISPTVESVGNSENDSNDRTEPDNTDTGKNNPSQSQFRKKPKAKKKARKRTS